MILKYLITVFINRLINYRIVAVTVWRPTVRTRMT